MSGDNFCVVHLEKYWELDGCDYCANAYVDTNLGTFDFDPINDDADAMMVFKALVDECKKKKLIIVYEDGDFAIGKRDWEYISDEVFNRVEYNNLNVCLALIAVMESK